MPIFTHHCITETIVMHADRLLTIVLTRSLSASTACSLQPTLWYINFIYQEICFHILGSIATAQDLLPQLKSERIFSLPFFKSLNAWEPFWFMKQEKAEYSSCPSSAEWPGWKTQHQRDESKEWLCLAFRVNTKSTLIISDDKATKKQFLHPSLIWVSIIQ